MAFTADQLQSFQVAWRFGGAVSTLGCLAIISSFLAFKKQQTLMNKLVVFMSIADLVASISQGSGR